MQEYKVVDATVSLKKKSKSYKHVNALTLSGDSTEHNKQDICCVVYWRSAEVFGQWAVCKGADNFPGLLNRNEDS